MRISDTVRYINTFTPATSEFMPDSQTRCLWHFDEANPVTAVIDHSGNNFDLIASGNPINIHLDDMIEVTGSILTVADTFDTYQWIDCATNLPIPGETNPSYTVTTGTGFYAVHVTHNLCELTSDCFGFHIEGVNEAAANSGAVIAQSGGILTISNTGNAGMQVELFDSVGKLIFSGGTENSTLSIDLTRYPAGLYFVHLVSADGKHQSLKFVLN
jgi:hypothetical protein